MQASDKTRSMRREWLRDHGVDVPDGMERPVVVELDTHPNRPGSFTCCRCGTILPRTSFPEAPTNWTCHWCLSDQNERTLVDQAKRRAEQDFKKVIRESRVETTTVPHIDEMLSEMLERYGGMTRFVGQWFADIQEARVRSPGSKLVLDSNMAIAKLIVKSNEMKQERDIAGMSDDDLAVEMKKMFLQYMAGDRISASMDRLSSSIMSQHNLTVNCAPSDAREEPGHLESRKKLSADEAALLAVMAEKTYGDTDDGQLQQDGGGDPGAEDEGEGSPKGLPPVGDSPSVFPE